MSRVRERECDAVSVLGEHRALLWRIAYRMLGSASDADDVLQEVALRWWQETTVGASSAHPSPSGAEATVRLRSPSARCALREAKLAAADRVAIHQPRAWLIAVCSRLCISQIRRTKRAREAYVGAWLPEPVASENADELSLGALLRLQRLKPAERIALVLHEALGLHHGELAAVLGRSPVACRQALARAKRKLRAAEGAGALQPAASERVEAFRSALAAGDARALVALLSEDAVLISDGGGRVISALRPIVSAARIARFFVGVLRKGRSVLLLELRPINGALGLVLCAGAAPFAAIAFEAVPEGAIARVFVVRNPDKLRAFAPA